MALALTQLTVRPIRIPKYDQTHQDFAGWIVANKVALRTYFNDLQPWFDEPIEYEAFVIEQYARSQVTV
jgi:hypothetical protein